MLSFLASRPWWFPDHKTSLAALYATESLRNFGLSLVGIFIPIYIWQFTGNFFWLPAYIFIASVSILIFTFPFIALIRKIGIFKSVFLSNILRLVLLGALLYAPQFLPLLVLAAVLEGILIPTYWIPYHFIYCKEGTDGAFGRQIGLMGMFSVGASFLAPLLGGLVISQFGFPALYVLGIVIILISSLPLGFARDHLEIEAISSFSDIVRGFLAKEDRPVFLGLSSLRVAATVESFLIWPIFLFTVVDSFAVLGGIASALTLFWLVAVGPISTSIDKLGFKKALWVGSGTSALFWGTVGFATSVPAVFGLALARTIFSPFLGITPDVIVYTIARSRKILDFIVRRELAIHVGGLFAAIVIAGLWALFPANWPVLFSVGAAGSMGAVLIAYSKK